MFNRSKMSSSFALIFFVKDIMDNTYFTNSFYRNTYKNCHSWQVSFDEIGGTIKWVDPNYGIFSAEGFEW